VTGVADAADHAGGGENVGAPDVAGVGGPTSLSSNRWYTMSFSIFSPAIALAALPDIGLDKLLG